VLIVVCTGDWFGYLKENDCFENLGIDGKVLKWRAIIDETLPHASESWTLTKTDGKQLNIFKMKVCRRILGPVYGNGKENWRILTDKEIYVMVTNPNGPGSSVGIATGYGLDGPGIESRLGQDFSHTSRPTLGPIHPPVQWVPGLSRG
jgi:hypothetical protein